MHFNGVHINASGTGSIAVANGGAVLAYVNVNTSAASSLITVYNDTTSANSSNTVAVVDGTSKGSLWYLSRCPNGIFYSITGGVPDVTIGYQ